MKSLEVYLQTFFKEEKAYLLSFYPGLTLHRLRSDLKLYALLNGIDSEELFELLYIPHLSHPLTQFFGQLKTGLPLEYITGHAYFYRSLFKVNFDVLIPRSETEILVELASLEIQKNYRNKACRLIDIGTGSGIIALSLMMEDFATLEIVASDISEKALVVARKNYFNLRYSIPAKHQIKFLKSDRFAEVDGHFDIILSNPPYIKLLSDHDSVHHQVLSHEPAMALFLEDDLYDLWFEDFLKNIYEKLRPTGLSLIEGHELHLEHLAAMARSIGFSKTEIIKDYTGRNRFLRLKKEE